MTQIASELHPADDRMGISEALTAIAGKVLAQAHDMAFGSREVTALAPPAIESLTGMDSVEQAFGQKILPFFLNIDTNDPNARTKAIVRLEDAAKDFVMAKEGSFVDAAELQNATENAGKFANFQPIPVIIKKAEALEAATVLCRAGVHCAAESYAAGCVPADMMLPITTQTARDDSREFALAACA